MNSLAVIPARGGSKRIPRKNVRILGGRPAIYYSIHAALISACFKEVMVSTEDPEIAALATACGAQVPFLRSSENASDHATTSAVISEVIEQYEAMGKSFAAGCCIYPTAALLRPERIREGLDALLRHPDWDGVISVCRYSHPIQRAFRLEAGLLRRIHPEFAKTRTQDLPDSYFDAGQFYWFRIEAFQRTQTLVTNATGAIQLHSDESVDVDTEEDWQHLQSQFRKRYPNQ